MQRTAILTIAALTLSLAACDSKPAADAPKAEPVKTDAPAAEPTPADAPQANNDPTPPADPWEAKLASRVLAASGLDVGSKLSAFDIINCESGETYCQVCKFGGNPKIMAVGTVGDEKFRDDLRNLDAIAKKYEGKNVKAFAVITDIVDGKATTPSDPKALQAQADALRKELGLSMPVVVPAPEEGGANKIWDQYYNITASRTVMFSDGRNNVTFSAVGPEDWSGLATEIDKVVAEKAG